MDALYNNKSKSKKNSAGNTVEKTKEFKFLKSLKLPPKDYAIFGSGPLLQRGIRTLTNDLDIIARGDARKKYLS